MDPKNVLVLEDSLAGLSILEKLLVELILPGEKKLFYHLFIVFMVDIKVLFLVYLRRLVKNLLVEDDILERLGHLV